MRDGASADDALAELIAADPLGAVRQVGVVDANGGVAVHTGAQCIPCAGDAPGAHWTLPGEHDGRATPSRRRCPPRSSTPTATSRSA